jgi:hypothetical protein
MAKLQSEDVIWVQAQAPAGNWVNDMGFPTETRGRKAAIKEAKSQMTWRKKTYGGNFRLVETFFQEVR